MGGRPSPTSGTTWGPDATVALGRVPVDPLYSGSLIRFVAAFGLVVALVVTVATGAALWAGRQEAFTAAARLTGSLARALTDAVARSVNSIDVTLSSVADLAREAGLESGPIDLSRTVGPRLALAPHVRQILVVAADGRVLFDSAGLTKGGRMDVAAILEDLRRLPRSLAIGHPVEGRFIGGEGKAAGQALIPVSSAIRDANGAITALVVAAINPEHFHALFHEIEEETGVRVQLWRFDGILLAGDSLVNRRGFTAAAELPLFKTHLKVSEMGTFTDVDDDGVRRVTSYRTTLAWPMVVDVGLSVDKALVNWRSNVEKLAWPVGLVLLVVLGLTLVLVRTLGRRARDEARLRLSDRVLANVSNGVTIVDAGQPDLPLLYVNQAFERITGYAAAEVLGRNPRFLHHGAADQDGLDRIRLALASGSEITVKLWNLRADGIGFWNQVSLTPVRNGLGLITHWVGVLHDVTREELAREALNKAYEDVARYSADLERFSFVLAHHLQEPVRQMRLHAQLLLSHKGEMDAAEARAAAERIAVASARLVDLLRDVQTYLAVEREPLQGAVAAAGPALAAAIAAVAPRCPDGVLDVEHGALPSVALSQRRLDELFKILLENAVEYRHPDRAPRIVVTAEAEGRNWLFRVADNGIGIHPAYFERIFIALERLHLRSSESAGTGIGLAVARKIVEGAPGRIWVESDGTSGSTFLFTLPKV